jgi:hypothetical protein
MTSANRYPEGREVFNSLAVVVLYQPTSQGTLTVGMGSLTVVRVVIR